MDDYDLMMEVFKGVALLLLVVLVLTIGVGLYSTRERREKQPKWRERITRRR